MDKDLADEILKSISLYGKAITEDAKYKPVIANRDLATMHVLDRSRGLIRLRRNIEFELILSQPSSLASLNPFEIRCCLCSKVMSYPAWYHVIKYSVNAFHFFVCFSPDEPKTVTTDCIRR